MNLEIEKKSRVKKEEVDRVLEFLRKRCHNEEEVKRNDFYYLTSSGKEVRASVIKYFDGGFSKVELNHKEKIRSDGLEVNKEYTILCDNVISELINFLEALGFKEYQNKIKNCILFEHQRLKIAFVSSIESISVTGEILKLPDSYLEVECISDNIEEAEYLLKKFFDEVELYEIEDRRYIDILNDE